MQRQEPERKRTKNFAASLAVLRPAYGVEERENDVLIPSDKHLLVVSLGTWRKGYHLSGPGPDNLRLTPHP